MVDNDSTMPIVTPDRDNIDSTFQQTGDGEYQATHTCDDPEVSVDREYYVNNRDNTVHVHTTYYVEGKEVNVQEQSWALTEDGSNVQHSGEPVGTFAENNHNADPQLDIEFAQRSVQ